MAKRSIPLRIYFADAKQERLIVAAAKRDQQTPHPNMSLFMREAALAKAKQILEEGSAA